MSQPSTPPVTAAEFRDLRDRLIADPGVDGAQLRRSLTELTDAWLADVYAASLRDAGTDGDGVALVALGGFGRGELFPGSDLDLAVVHRGDAAGAAAVAEGVWYPVWDTGVHLGHSVWSIDEAVAVIGDDVETSTALLDARFLAGDADVADALTSAVQAAWKGSFDDVVTRLRADAEARRERFGDVAYSTEPNLKSGGGGLRDAQIPGWLGGIVELVDDDRASLAAARRWLSDVRVALHRVRPSSGEVLRLQDSDAVAEGLGIADSDELLTRISAAARDVDWILDEVWARAARLHEPVAGRRRRHRRATRARTNEAAAVATTTHEVGSGGDDAAVIDGPVAALTVAAAIAHDDARPDRALLAQIAEQLTDPATPWPPELRRAFVDLLGAGPGMIRVVESLDRVGVWEHLVPEWPVVRHRPQRAPHHRFTVDRHLLETVAIASTLTDGVDRSDLLLVAALVHDLGKGRGGDHSSIGVELAGRLGAAMGFEPGDVTVLETLVRLHLLLPEVALRRDIDDPATIESVAEAVGSSSTLALLAALTEADARATGPSAWTDWRAGLVRTLVDRTDETLAGDVPEVSDAPFPSADQLAVLEAGTTHIDGTGRTLTVAAPDTPGLFSRVAGALVLSGLNIVAAQVTSQVAAQGAMALEVFTVAPAFARGELSEAFEIDWAKVTDEVERCIAGRVALAARVAERATVYHRRSLDPDGGIHVRFDDTIRGESVIEIDAPDRIGVLFGITRALADLRVDIRFARVDTRIDRVVDAFSITDDSGVPVTDPDYRAEIERAIRHALTR